MVGILSSLGCFAPICGDIIARIISNEALGAAVTGLIGFNAGDIYRLCCYPVDMIGNIIANAIGKM